MYSELDRWTVARIQVSGLPMKQHFIYPGRELRDYSPLQEMIAAITDWIRRSYCLTAIYDSYPGGKASKTYPLILFYGGNSNLYLATHYQLRSKV